MSRKTVGGRHHITAHDREPSAFTRDDLGYQRAATAATRAGPARLRDVGASARAVLDAGADFSVGNAVAVANDHR